MKLKKRKEKEGTPKDSFKYLFSFSPRTISSNTKNPYLNLQIFASHLVNVPNKRTYEIVIKPTELAIFRCAVFSFVLFNRTQMRFEDLFCLYQTLDGHSEMQFDTFNLHELCAAHSKYKKHVTAPMPIHMYKDKLFNKIICIR